MIVIVQKPPPPLVAHSCRASGGINDIGEQHCRKHTFKLYKGAIPITRDKLFDITKQCVGFPGPKAVVSLGILDVLGALDVLGQAATRESNRHHRIGLARQHQRRNLDGLQNGGNIYLTVQLQKGPNCAGAA